MLLEQRGKAFYQKAADTASDESVKAFFQLMASEEDKHVEILSAQFKHYRDKNKFILESSTEKESSDFASTVLDEKLKQRISAAGFEAAAISAAIAMEERAIRLYTKRAAVRSHRNQESRKALCPLRYWPRKKL